MKFLKNIWGRAVNSNHIAESYKVSALREEVAFISAKKDEQRILSLVDIDDLLAKKSDAQPDMITVRNFSIPREMLRKAGVDLLMQGSEQPEAKGIIFKSRGTQFLYGKV